MMKVKLILLLCLFCTFSQALSNNGTCGTKQKDGKYTKFCCDFFWQTENGCVACNDGFESFNGSLCTPCSNNNYGKRCLKQCNCMTNQRCDHISGCVDFTTTVDLYQGYSTVMMSVTEEESSNDKPKEDVSNDENLYEYVYAFGGVAVFGMVLLGFYYKIKCYKLQNTINIHDPETNHTSEVNEIENVYDEIDELALDDMNQQPHHNSSSIEDDSSNSSGTTNSGTTNNEGYLNPYQPIIQNTDTHTYSLTSAAVSSTEQEICNQACVNVKKYENLEKSSNDSDSQSLDYSDIPIDLKPVTVDLDGYENTRIF